MAWLKARLHEGSTWKGLLAIVAALATYYLTGQGLYASVAAGSVAYIGGSVVLPDKVGTP